MAWPSGAVRSFTRSKVHLSASCALASRAARRAFSSFCFCHLAVTSWTMAATPASSPLSARDEDDVELDGDPRAVLLHGRNRERIACRTS